LITHGVTISCDQDVQMPGDAGASPHYSWCLNLTGESSKVHYGPFKGM
jgi:hypothetical protein